MNSSSDHSSIISSSNSSVSIIFNACPIVQGLRNAKGYFHLAPNESVRILFASIPQALSSPRGSFSEISDGSY